MHRYLLISARNNKTFTLCVILLGVVISLKGLWDILPLPFNHEHSKHTERQIQLKCTNDSFSLPGMDICHPWLGCSEVETDIQVTDIYLGQGAEKVVKKGYWQGHPVALSYLRHQDYLEDFQHNLEMLQLFSKEPGAQANKIVQLIGWCTQQIMPVLVTEMHSFGAANKLHSVLEEFFPGLDNLVFRFDKCIEFVEILNILHSHPDGPWVLCDANDPQKALSQFSLSQNLTLVLHDMDALPSVNRSSGQLVKCGHRELHGEFVAPEQLWPYDMQQYDDSMMPHYDEKIDIWKIPDVCNFLIGNVKGFARLQLHLFNIHSECKQEDPQKRPTTGEVLKLYKAIRLKLQ